MRYFSLFSGIGGFELGIEKACRKKKRKAFCVGHSEINPHAITVYQRHFPKHKNFGDITKIKPGELPDFNLLVAGFPCQPFSIEGKRKGFKDPRGKLFFDIIRILKAKKPKRFILENVPHLLSHDKGKTFGKIAAALIRLGYRLQYGVLNSKDFGIPQNRSRVFLIGHYRLRSEPPALLLIKKPQADIVLPTLTARYYGAQATGGYIGEKSKKNGKITHLRRLSTLECERLQGFPDNWTEAIPDSKRYECLGNAVTVPVITGLVAALFQTQSHYQ